MSTPQSFTSKAVKAYREADASIQQVLEQIFGAEVLNQKITDRIKTFDDVLAEMGASAADYTLDPASSIEEQEAIQCKRLKLIARALNEGWKADVGNINQYKYYPYFNVIQNKYSSGFGLSVGVCDYDSSYSDVGARPYFKDSSTATYAGKQFLTEYETYARLLNECE